MTLNSAKDDAKHSAKAEIQRYGVPASPGIVIGKAHVKDSETLAVPHHLVAAADVPVEVENFNTVIKRTRRELGDIKSRIAEQMGEDHAKIFDAHMLILDDVMVIDDTVALIKKERLNAAAAFRRVVNRVLDSFGQIEDEYLKDRYADIRDVKRRVLGHLLGLESRPADEPAEPSIVVSNDLSPSDTAQFDRRTTLGYATDQGGRTSHTAILARSQGVPAVVGLVDVSSHVETGDTIIVDGNTGAVVVNPGPETLREYREEIRRFKDLENRLLTLTGYPAVTLDQREFMLAANVDLPDDVGAVLEFGGQAIGLFRTEYIFIARDHLPTEDEQYRLYREVVEQMEGKPVVIRTLDVGGDKIVGYLDRSVEVNPFMGWRGIRFCLSRLDIFKSQLRAIYRASAHGTVRIMFPMISQIEEVIRAREVCEEVMDDLTRQGIAFDSNVELGIMVETPAAVATADAIAREVAFFSIGTNDLIQYSLAVDRGNAKIAHLYKNLHPGVLRMLKSTIEAGHKRGIHVGICGEMAGDPLSVPLLVGLSVDEFSASPSVIPEIKRIVRGVTADECKSLIRRVFRCRTSAEIEREAGDFLRSRVPEAFEMERGRK